MLIMKQKSVLSFPLRLVKTKILDTDGIDQLAEVCGINA